MLILKLSGVQKVLCTFCQRKFINSNQNTFNFQKLFERPNKTNNFVILYKLFTKAFELFRICTLEDKEVNSKKGKDCLQVSDCGQNCWVEMKCALAKDFLRNLTVK